MDATTDERRDDLSSRDIGELVRALLTGIQRGELNATSSEVRFLQSVAQLLPPEPSNA
jgi:hypothetical protein